MTILSIKAATITGAGTFISAKSAGYDSISYLNIMAILTGVVGGTLDVTIQDSAGGTIWYDYIRFAQIASNAATTTYAFTPALTNNITAIGSFTDPTVPVPVLAAGSARGGHPLKYMRIVCIAGAGTSAGKDQIIHFLSK